MGRQQKTEPTAEPKAEQSRAATAAYEVVEIDGIKPHPDNPRRGDVEAIRASIRANQFFGAVLVQRSTRRILAGEHRWRAAKAEGMATIPVLWVDVDDDKALRILLADNRGSDLAGYDEEKLAAMLRDLAATETGFEGTGYDQASFDDLLAELSKSEFVSTGGGGGGSTPGRLGTTRVQQKAQVRAVLYADEVHVFEQALLATGEVNRAAALMKISKAYLDQQRPR